MKIEKSHLSAAPSGPHAQVSAAEYPQAAIAWIRASGGSGVVVGREAKPRQWCAWMAYFGGHTVEIVDKNGRRRTINRGRSCAGLKAITVPTEWPLEFDLSAPAWTGGDEAWESPGLGRRRELADAMRALVASSGLGLARRARPPDVREAPTPEAQASARAFHEARLAELAKAPPARASAELAAELAGMPRPGRPAESRLGEAP